MSNRKMIERVGEINYNSDGEIMEVIEYINKRDIKVRISNTYDVNTRYQTFKKGNIKNPFFKSKYGMGYLGIGNYISKYNGKSTREYSLWGNMLSRCYNENNIANQKSYNDCEVCEDWLNFQNFAKWYSENYYELPNETAHLDKDILYKGNKLYCPENCVFVPQSINSLFTKRNVNRGKLPIGVYYNKNKKRYISQISHNGTMKHLGNYDNEIDAYYAYKKHKESEIREIAEQYRCSIPEKLYNALLVYKVEITD